MSITLKRLKIFSFDATSFVGKNKGSKMHLINFLVNCARLSTYTANKVKSPLSHEPNVSKKSILYPSHCKIKIMPAPKAVTPQVNKVPQSVCV